MQKKLLKFCWIWPEKISISKTNIKNVKSSKFYKKKVFKKVILHSNLTSKSKHIIFDFSRFDLKLRILSFEFHVKICITKRSTCFLECPNIMSSDNSFNWMLQKQLLGPFRPSSENTFNGFTFVDIEILYQIELLPNSL